MDIDFWTPFWQGVGIFINACAEAFQQNPLPWLAIGGLILLGLLLPETRRRRRRG